MYCPGKNQIKVFGREFEGSPFLKRGSLNNPYVTSILVLHLRERFSAYCKKSAALSEIAVSEDTRENESERKRHNDECSLAEPE